MRHELDHGGWREALALANASINFVSSLDNKPEFIELRISFAELLLKLSHASNENAFQTQALQILAIAAEHAKERGLTRLQSFALGYHGHGLLDTGAIEPALDKLNSATLVIENMNPVRRGPGDYLPVISGDQPTANHQLIDESGIIAFTKPLPRGC